MLESVKAHDSDILSEDVIDRLGATKKSSKLGKTTKHSVDENKTEQKEDEQYYNDYSAEPYYLETEEQAKRAGYPTIDGKQVFPFKTWVKTKSRNNFGLVTGLGQTRANGEQYLKVSFWNKTKNKRAIVEVAVSQMEVVTGQYQREEAELAALLKSEPEKVTKESFDEEYDKLWDSIYGYQSKRNPEDIDLNEAEDYINEMPRKAKERTNIS